MAAAVIEAIGLISGALGIIQFGIDNFAEPDSVGSVVKVAVGLDVNGGLNNAGGDLPDVRLFNEAGGFLGITADPGSIGSGEAKEITVSHNGDNGQQATYALLSANDNAICIAYASITWPDGNNYAWIGDWGRQCGGSWYYSNYYISGSDVTPDCFWIDSNGDQPQTGFQIHWPEFVSASGDLPTQPSDKDALLDRLCNAGPPFKMYTEKDPRGITFWTKTKRSEEATAEAYAPWKSAPSAKFADNRSGHSATVPRQQSLHANQLVIDNNPNHAADALCGSDTSLGPDFVDLTTSSFCRMEDKTMFPLCSDEITDNCFNTDVQKLIVNGVATRDSDYGRVLDWTSQ
ncbi:uncharacterized protein BCR38DRAFT_450541 [Pseudomassariella vexata]|uniref:Uncharacterized protein n=1 Tax=Pseudomassariella vexata TaxID=1141098 RepID=A0A1Y2DD08_9PEZI|nr:uncharacterized protein BCR38DRAFT_450541 [Pseudomassariella vexata]ORY56996.1 hypothetical protein BCR38DRAFT_450541 [Pseudomassariella vexata]